MTRLSVNINKIATLRNARGGQIPSVTFFAKKCQEWGADGITVHPRPDGRHIRYSDVIEINPLIHTSFNIEGYPDEAFMKLVSEVKPDQVTLVPDPPGVLTSNAGWAIKENMSLLQDRIGAIRELGMSCSLFVEPDATQISRVPETGADKIELYTESYANCFKNDPEAAIKPYLDAAETAKNLGLKINAGHDLNLENLGFLNTRIPFLFEVSIGHALISDALVYGMANTIGLYKRLLQP